MKMTSFPIDKLTILTPVRNEEASIQRCIEAVGKMLKESGISDYEHVIVDNNSDDRTTGIASEMSRRWTHVRLVENTRNMGVHESFVAGLRAIDGDAVVPILADLQTPVELVLKLVSESEASGKSVIAVRASVSKRRTRILLNSIFYWYFEKWGSPSLPASFMGFGLYRGPELHAITRSGDPEPFLRGLALSRTDNLPRVTYFEPNRQAGTSSSGVFRDYDFIRFALVRHSKFGSQISKVLMFSQFLSSVSVATITLIATRKIHVAVLFASAAAVVTAPIYSSLFHISNSVDYLVGRHRVEAEKDED